MRQLRAVALASLLLCASPAAALVGNAGAADPAMARHIVMIVGSRGNYCTGTAIARDLVLTSAHCVAPGADYKLIEKDAAGTPRLADIARIARHPQFSAERYQANLATADVALLKPVRPLPADTVPASLARSPTSVVPGDRFVIAGYGLAVPDDGRSGGTARAATLTVTGKPGTLQIRLFDPTTRGERAGLGACAGDSGAPAFDTSGGRAEVIGVVSWATGPRLSGGCGGLTGVTPLTRYQDWIFKAAREMGSPLPP